ncbi:hypothetical protein H0H92_010678, partial [Tricholoma furcatifolium]
PDSLDTLLPLLIPVTQSHQSQLSIAQLLASAICIPFHRTAVTEWLPPSERTKAKEAAKPRREWEKVTLAPGPARMGGWAVRQLLGLISDSGSSNSNPNLKLQEAALGAFFHSTSHTDTPCSDTGVVTSLALSAARGGA